MGNYLNQFNNMIYNLVYIFLSKSKYYLILEDF